MNPEREAEIRDRLRLSEYDWYTEPLVEDLLEGLDAARAERDELRAAVDVLEHYVTIRRDDMRDSLKSGLLEGAERWCAAREGATLTETLDKGRELGLWK